jgi:hypothetical protein
MVSPLACSTIERGDTVDTRTALRPHAPKRLLPATMPARLGPTSQCSEPDVELLLSGTNGPVKPGFKHERIMPKSQAISVDSNG